MREKLDDDDDDVYKELYTYIKALILLCKRFVFFVSSNQLFFFSAFPRRK